MPTEDTASQARPTIIDIDRLGFPAIVRGLGSTSLDLERWWDIGEVYRLLVGRGDSKDARIDEGHSLTC